MSDVSSVEEPRLSVVRDRRAGPSRRFLALLVGLLLVVVPCGVLLGVRGNLLLPFEGVTVFEGRVASKADFFEDEEVRRILLRHRIRVHITTAGSRELAEGDLSPYDFVLPSGQPSADKIIARDDLPKHYAHVHRPFVSPLVLATYRSYALALRDRGVAVPQGDDPEPLYYHLDLAKFLGLVADGVTWNSLGIRKHGPANGNVVAAHTSHVCQSNSADTFLAQVAFTLNGNARPEDRAKGEELAARIKPLLSAQGMPGADVSQAYTTDEGRRIAPVVVVYEHQYLAHQLRHAAAEGGPDTDRVLLYPTNQFLTQPQFISLDPRADRLGELIAGDPDLQERALRLGLRPLGTPAEGLGFGDFLQRHHVPAPGTAVDDTRTVLPQLEVLERMISLVGDCPSASTAASAAP